MIEGLRWEVIAWDGGNGWDFYNVRTRELARGTKTICLFEAKVRRLSFLSLLHYLWAGSKFKYKAVKIYDRKEKKFVW